jgi:hypothetical protein
MLSLNMAASQSTPAVRFDPQKRRLDIRGESYPENAAAFYEPILSRIGQWLREAGAGAFEVMFELRYYNSSSSKAIMNLMDCLAEAAEKGWTIKVHWRFHEENDIIQESGEDLQDDYDLLDISLVTLPTQV